MLPLQVLAVYTTSIWKLINRKGEGSRLHFLSAILSLNISEPVGELRQLQFKFIITSLLPYNLYTWLMI
jgi:hypothetical protein